MKPRYIKTYEQFLEVFGTVNEDTKYEVFWVDRDYKSGTKEFYDDPQGAPENGLKKAKLFLKKLEDKDKKDRYGLYRDLGVRTISEGQEINEGGNALTTTQRILNSDIPDTLVYIEGLILPRLGLEGWDIDCAVVGSAGKKKPEDTSGDIDVAVSIDRIAGHAGIDVGGVLKWIQNRLSEAGYETNIQYGFHQVNVAVPIAGDPQKGYCQVDLMVTDNLEWSKFIYHSPDYRKAESRYSGAFRGMLINAIASEGMKSAVKHDEESGQMEEYEQMVNRATHGLFQVRKTLRGKRGLVKTPKLMKDYEKKITNIPEEAIKILFGDGVKAKDVESFEGIWKIMHGNQFPFPGKRETIANKFLWYMKNMEIPVPSEISEKYPNLIKESTINMKKYVKLYAELSEAKKEYFQDISPEEFAKIKKGDTVQYMGGSFTVVSADGYVLSLKDNRGKVRKVNLSQFIHGGRIKESVNEKTGYEAMRDLDDEVGDRKANQVLKGKRDPISWNTIKGVYFADMEKGDVCNPLHVDFIDGTETTYYGYDVLRILDDYKIIKESVNERKDRFAGSDPRAGSTIQGTGFNWGDKKGSYTKEPKTPTDFDKLVKDLKKIKGPKVHVDKVKRGSDGNLYGVHLNWKDNRDTVSFYLDLQWPKSGPIFQGIDGDWEHDNPIDLVNKVLNESYQRTSEINTLEKFLKASKLKKGRTSIKQLLQFIHDNFERITGEKYQDGYQFMTNDFIADIISHYKYGEEVIDIWKSLYESLIAEANCEKIHEHKYKKIDEKTEECDCGARRDIDDTRHQSKYESLYVKKYHQLNEADIKQGKKLVNIMVGRFQPFHIGHYKACEELYKENGNPVVLVSVRGSGKSGKGTSFSEDTMAKMMKDVISKSGFIIDHVEIRAVAFDTMLFPALRPKYEPVLFGAGEDRTETYERQRLSMMEKHKNKLNMRSDFAIHLTGRYGSGSSVRDAIENNDKAGFEKQMPKFLHGYWDILSKEMDVNEGNIDSINEKRNPKWEKFLKNSGKQASNAPKDFVKDAYDKGFEKDDIIDGLVSQSAGFHSKEDAEDYYFNVVGQYESVNEDINKESNKEDSNTIEDGPIDRIARTIEDCKKDLAQTGASIEKLKIAIENGANEPMAFESLTKLTKIHGSLLLEMATFLSETKTVVNKETIEFHIGAYRVDDDPYEVAKEIGSNYNWTKKEIEKAEKIIRKNYLK